LGVADGDTLFVHSSFKSLGHVEGGAQSVVEALQEVIGTDGVLLMPSFSLKPKEKEVRAALWNVQTTPSTVGWITEYFRTLPGTVRSDHYSHSVAARGRGAEAFVSGHRERLGMSAPWDLEPWGKTYGSASPFIKAYEDARGRLLMLGVDYHSSTFCHVVEVMDWNRRLAQDPKAEYYWLDRAKAGAHWDAVGYLKRGKVGQAECRLFGIRDFVDTLAAAVRAEPWRWYKWYPAPKAQQT
jgi:aminoglycoside 3-N-acetyltransferase